MCWMFALFRRIGVIGIDLALSEIEDLLRSTYSGEGEVFMVNLADGTAIVHPLAKHSYEVRPCSVKNYRFISFSQ